MNISSYIQKKGFQYLLIFLFGILIYLPSLNVKFVNDEIAFISRNQAENFSELISLFDKKDYDGEYYRPFPNFISGITTLLFNYNVVSYRIFNILLHSFAAVLVFLFCCELLKNHQSKKIISLFAALFFIAFPIHDYAVIWHTDMFDRIMLIFFLAALNSFLKNDFKPTFISLFIFSLSLLSKEMAFSFPIIIFCLTFFLYQEKFNFKKSLLNALPFLAISAAFILLRIILFSNNIFTAADAHSGASIFTVIKNYILFGGLLGFPFYLREIEEFILQYKLIFFLSGGLIFILIIYYFIKNRRKDYALIFFILFIVITIAPASRLFMRWYLYLPSVGFTAALAYFLFTLNIKKYLAVGLASAILIIYSVSIINKELKWVECSNKADMLMQNLVDEYKDEIIKNGVEFLTIPAKINDVPVFHLGFNFHLNYYLNQKIDDKLTIDSRSSLTSFEDSIKIEKIDEEYFLEHSGDNYFILFDNQKNIKFHERNKQDLRIHSINISTEEENKILFTFSKGRFILLSAPPGIE